MLKRKLRLDIALCTTNRAYTAHVQKTGTIQQGAILCEEHKRELLSLLLNGINLADLHVCMYVCVCVNVSFSLFSPKIEQYEQNFSITQTLSRSSFAFFRIWFQWHQNFSVINDYNFSISTGGA